ncbi:hypothetical protein ElyMa_003523200 [Elysia marginata]|uniref:Uncharacterized protein n=1 Tax=Elysia marginata TaxID=1093978 RepID=A0AAV4EI52_9GAST|nr:hypothetical protein ElyMa_003523200 [Elysia marginata]
MFLSPSQVHFTSCIDHLGTSKMAADSHISDVYMEMKMQRRFPRLQVVKKCGHYFTLDNTRLYMFRRMEEEGHCKLVPVDIILLKKVPEAVQDMMVLPSGASEAPLSNTTCLTCRRYQIVLVAAWTQGLYNLPFFAPVLTHLEPLRAHLMVQLTLDEESKAGSLLVSLHI